MSIPKSVLTSPPNILPKSVLKFARIDCSFARYTFTFCVTLPTLILMQVSLWLFLSCMRVFIASTMSVWRNTVRVQGSKFCFLGDFLIVKHKFPLCNILVHWWVGNLGNCYLPLSVQLHLLQQKYFKWTESVVWKELRRRVGNQLDCKWIHTQMTLFSSFSQNFPRTTSSCSSLIVYVGGFLVAMATFSQISCVNCGL